MKETFSNIIHRAFREKRTRVKRYVYVAAVYRRDRKGRFLGGLQRRGYTRRIFDYVAPKASAMEMIAENITANNSLLRILMEKKGIMATKVSGV